MDPPQKTDSGGPREIDGGLGFDLKSKEIWGAQLKEKKRVCEVLILGIFRLKEEKREE